MQRDPHESWSREQTCMHQTSPGSSNRPSFCIFCFELFFLLVLFFFLSFLFKDVLYINSAVVLAVFQLKQINKSEFIIIRKTNKKIKKFIKFEALKGDKTQVAEPQELMQVKIPTWKQKKWLRVRMVNEWSLTCSPFPLVGYLFLSFWLI